MIVKQIKNNINKDKEIMGEGTESNRISRD